MAKKQKAKILFYDIEILPQHFYTNMGADRSTRRYRSPARADEPLTHPVGLTIGNIDDKRIVDRRVL